MFYVFFDKNSDADGDHHASSPHRNAQPGDITTFGTYPQTADGTDGTPIKWRVLHRSGSELFLVNEYILDCVRPAVTLNLQEATV
jgi:hypothetical protein